MSLQLILVGMLGVLMGACLIAFAPHLSELAHKQSEEMASHSEYFEGTDTNWCRPWTKWIVRLGGGAWVLVGIIGIVGGLAGW